MKHKLFATVPAFITLNSTSKLATRLCVAVALFLVSFRLFAQTPVTGTVGAPAGLSQNAQNEIAALLQEKAGRTAAQQKMDSQLVHALKKNRGEAFAPGAPNMQMDVKMGVGGY
jgi:hypothetical protein